MPQASQGAEVTPAPAAAAEADAPAVSQDEPRTIHAGSAGHAGEPQTAWQSGLALAGLLGSSALVALGLKQRRQGRHATN